MIHRGVFVVIDGPNGVGKTTAIELVKAQRNVFALPTYYTKEPTSSDLGKFIRLRQDAYSAETLACLIAANRYEHIKEVIEPNLQQGKLVISDRFITSSLVYQGMDGLSDEFILSLNSKTIIPDLIIVLMANESILNDRLMKRQDKITRFEEADKRTFEINRYHSAIRTLGINGYRIAVVNTDNLSIMETAKELINHIQQI